MTTRPHRLPTLASLRVGALADVGPAVGPVEGPAMSAWRYGTTKESSMTQTKPTTEIRVSITDQVLNV